MQSTSLIEPIVEHHDIQACRRQILQGSPTAIMNRKVGLKAAIIDQNLLFGECLCAGLRVEDPNLALDLYDSVASWLSKSTSTDDDLLLICLNDQEFDQVAKNTNENINRLRKAGISIKFLIISNQNSSKNALIALEVGASGYISSITNLAL